MKKNLAILTLLLLLFSACAEESLLEKQDAAREAIALMGDLNDYVVPSSTDYHLLQKEEDFFPVTSEIVELGRLLFYADEGGDREKKTACGNCHKPQKFMKDDIFPSEDNVETPPILLQVATPGISNINGQNTLLSLEQLGLAGANAQFNEALLDKNHLAPAGQIQSIVGMGVHGSQITKATLIERNDIRQAYRRAFPQVNPIVLFSDEFLPDYASIAIDYFERTIQPKDTKFQDWLQDVIIDKDTFARMTTIELKGLKLVVQKCQPCHNAPYFQSDTCYDIGIAPSYMIWPQYGFEADSTQLVGRYAIDSIQEHKGAFSTPTIYGATLQDYYTRSAAFSDLGDLLAYKNSDSLMVTDGHTHKKPLGLDEQGIYQVEVFIKTLEPRWLDKFGPKEK